MRRYLRTVRDLLLAGGDVVATMVDFYANRPLLVMVLVLLLVVAAMPDIMREIVINCWRVILFSAEVT